MAYKLLTTITLLLFLNLGFSSSFFVPDSDSATLFEIAMIISKDLKTTLKLLEVAKGTQETLGKFHNSVARKYYLSQRIIYRLERIKRLNKVKPKTLREINSAIYEFKSLFKSLEKLYADAGMELIKTKDELLVVEEKKLELRQNHTLIEAQESRSINGGDILENTSNTAINTGQTNLLLNKLNTNVLDGNSYQLIDNKFQLMKFMREIEHTKRVKKWAGLDDFIKDEKLDTKDRDIK